MKKQLKNRVPQFGMFVAALVAICVTASPSKAQSGFTFKLDQHETVLNDQANLEILEAAIESGMINGNDPAVQQQLSRAELQQYMSAYNAMCTLKTSARRSRTQPTIAIGNGFEKSSNPTSPNYDPTIKPSELIYYPSGNFNTFDRDVDPNNLHATNSNLNIIGLKITLGNSTKDLYEFAAHTTNNQNALPMVVPSNTSVTSTLQNSDNTLFVSFGNGGLLPGQMATMQIQLSQDNPTPTTPWPSMTEFFSNDSTMTVIYQDPVTMNTTESVPATFANFLQNAVQWAAQLNTPLQHIDGSVPSFEINGEVIPEPSSVILGIGSLGLFLLKRRRAA